jgi:hypothetical protein
MRVNVYAEEVSGDIEIVRTTADTGASFVGLRIYLHSSEKLHHRAGDDDRSAVTFWVKSGRDGYRIGDEETLASLFDRACSLLGAARMEDAGA